MGRHPHHGPCDAGERDRKEVGFLNDTADLPTVRPRSLSVYVWLIRLQCLEEKGAKPKGTHNEITAFAVKLRLSN